MAIRLALIAHHYRGRLGLTDELLVSAQSRLVAYGARQSGLTQA